MRTPICDFVRDYAAGDPVRMHMPGHKGKKLIGPEPLDITEIAGADVLYSSRTMIRESEENAAQLFGTARTVYSAEGSSLCIRAMLYLALLSAREKGIRPCLLAGRNAHRTLMTAAALLDLEIRWMMPEPEEGLTETKQPGTKQPGTGRPGTEQPGNEESVKGKPGTEQPGNGVGKDWERSL